MRLRDAHLPKIVDGAAERLSFLCIGIHHLDASPARPECTHCRESCSNIGQSALSGLWLSAIVKNRYIDTPYFHTPEYNNSVIGCSLHIYALPLKQMTSSKSSCVSHLARTLQSPGPWPPASPALFRGCASYTARHRSLVLPGFPVPPADHGFHNIT